ncbi:MAG: T9SS type A sorting domain-containing protein [Ignavibacteria bacterium]|nr:T9SS type A sorting domain-containing protein [Ignavibacteria bacterium]
MKIFTQKKLIINTMIIFLMSFFCSSVSFSQLNVGGQPISSLMELNSVFSNVTMPEFDSRKFLEEDAAVANIPDMPMRYGKIFETELTLNNSGTWQTLSDGSRIWRLGIRSDNAMSLNLAYKNFYMPEGATFFVYNPNKNFVFGAFTKLNNSEDRQFATTPVPGNEIVLEYYEPVYSAGLGSLTVSQVVHAYKDIMGFNSVLELPCNININCPIGAPWVEQKRSVSRITFNQGGSGYLCSGALMNNTQNDRASYYLTAQHCQTDNFSTMVFYFNYEASTCSGTSGPLNQTLTGSTLKAQNFDTDFQLLLLNNSVPAAYNAYFNGWDKSGAGPQNQTAIHHPGGAIKKISYDVNPAATSSGFGGRLTNGFWQVIWDFGMTEGGSSGCPLYDENKRVIGQNLGGTPAQCENPQAVAKVFGKFSESWAHGGNSTNQIKDWLDPNNTGVSTLDGIDAVTGIAPVANFTSNTQSLPIGGGSVDFYDLSSNGPTSWSWSFPGGTPSTSNVRNPTGITYTATGPYTVSLTATNAFGPNLKTVTNYITVAGAPLNAFTQTAPAPNTTIPVSQTDLSLFQFKWTSSNPSPTVTYKLKIKKAGPSAEILYPSDNNGLDTVKSFRRSFLDSLATTFGTTGDSVLCLWKVTAYNGLDSVSTSQIIITIRRNPIGINQISSLVPEKLKLYNNYPNPFNPETNIRFDITKSQKVKLRIFNMLGEEQAVILDQNISPGSYNVSFNAANLSSGMYLYRLETEGYSETKRMVLVK